MSKKFNIKPPIWPRELTFQEFKKLNPQINENKLVHLYNQYLGKYLGELQQKKVHFKQSLNKHLVVELSNFAKNLQFLSVGLEGGAGGFNYAKNGIGIGSAAIGVYLSLSLEHFPLPVDAGFPRFTVK